MPELPEVETVVRNLRPSVLNQKILSTSVLCPKMVNFDPTILAGQKITGVMRRGKYIILQLAQGYLIVHLRMTGKLFVVNDPSLNQPQYQKHLHVQFKLSNGWLLFQDQRKFGQVWFTKDLNWLEAKLGPEPLTEKFTWQLLAQICQSSRALKPLLLDQSQIAGLGNIYVDEVLWYAGLHPQTPADLATVEQVKKMHAGIQQILTKAIDNQGTTFLSYSFGGEQQGQFLNQLKVFSRAGQGCARCGNIIAKIRVAQRGTYICVFCQKFLKEKVK